MRGCKYSEKVHMPQKTGESGRGPEGSSGIHRPRNSLIMPLQGHSQLLMAFCTLQKGMKKQPVP